MGKVQAEAGGSGASPGSAAAAAVSDPEVFSYDKGTPVARPVRKAKGLNSETAWLSKREFGRAAVHLLRSGVVA